MLRPDPFYENRLKMEVVIADFLKSEVRLKALSVRF